MRTHADTSRWRAPWRAAASVLILAVIAPPLLHAQSTLSSYLRDVVSYNAPIIIEETENPWPDPESQDHILPVDFDGDDNAANNAEHAKDTVVTNGAATAYFSIVETGNTADQGYFFINYYFYHASDGGAHFYSAKGLIDEPGHENDLEGVALIVKKSFYHPYGQIVAAYSEAHGALIPWVNPYADLAAGSPAGGGARGDIRFWHDATFDVYRPVVAIRSQKHGTYFAQDCSGATPYLDLPGSFPHFGMWMGSPDINGTYTSCIHSDSHAITYVPVPLNVAPTSGIGATRLGPSVRTGTWWYQLKELATSPMWQYRSQSGLMLWGNVVYISGGLTGLDAFTASNSNQEMANPPWQWRGGRGICHNIYIELACWYSFGMDNTDYYSTPVDWPLAPDNGMLVSEPAVEASLRFPSLPQLSSTVPMRYNPYLANPPVCCSAYPLGGTISGPDYVAYQATGSWTAEVGGGTAPYSYYWSGIAAGSGQSVEVENLETPGTLYLDVYDAAGHHLALSMYIQVQCPPAQPDGPEGPGCPT